MLVGVVALASCSALGPSADGGWVTTTVAPAPAGDAEWVLAGSDLSVYLRWTAADGQLTGAARVAERRDGTTIDVQDGELVGAINGGQVVLSAVGRSWSGAATAEALVLDTGAPDATAQELTLAPGSAADFDAAVTAMQGAPAPSTPASEPPSTTVPSTATGAGGITDRRARDLQAAVDELDRLIALTDAVTAVEGALGDLDEAVAVVYDRRCGEARVALLQVENAKRTIQRLVEQVLTLADTIEGQRNVAYLLGIAYGKEPGADAALSATADDAVDRADRYVEQLRAYAFAVGAKTAATVDSARGALAEC